MTMLLLPVPIYKVVHLPPSQQVHPPNQDTTLVHKMSGKQAGQSGSKCEQHSTS